MYFESLRAALLMDGHGPYVWGAYGVSILVLLFLIISPRLRQRRLLREVRGEMRRSEQRAAAPPVEGS